MVLDIISFNTQHFNEFFFSFDSIHLRKWQSSFNTQHFNKKFSSDSIHLRAILKHSGSSRFGKEDPGYLRRCLQVIFSTSFFLDFAKKTQVI